ncbi:glycerophosphodiester phosphodiesterase family protein [Actinomadura sp. BRA 177]|uniref:glycerophosphodiester phosphodiesterase family protein n=1 Tax=Actinomadura sp. BRA 177 TaxID=2745202 RepID=UPI0015955217|nr:glycerophosphodiester phosphodiesterase family protein [Actinomadura sp. BRA 177]NVI86249.1 glycerophosphodiester phosphodiesterase [Actinomadura sp. BRA 177]
MISTVEVHGHRGARGLRPENTLPGFAHALALGVDAIELDVGLSADGVVVLNHDQVLSPRNLADTAPAQPDDPDFPYVGKPIRELTLAQLRTVDAGAGSGIPTLAEACTLLAPADVTLSVELKTDPTWTDEEVELFTAAVVNVLKSRGMTERTRLLAFDWRVLVEARCHYPELGRVALIERKTLVPNTAWLAGQSPKDPVAAALAIGATALSPEHVITTPALIEDAHTAALPVIVWTVNTHQEMTRFIDYGVDAIVSDYPDRLLNVLAAAV